VASGGGLETFSSLLAVSPRARSGNSLLSRSRNNRHGRLGRNSVGGGRQHYETEDSTHRDESKEKIWKGCLKPGYLTSVRFFFLLEPMVASRTSWAWRFEKKTRTS